APRPAPAQARRCLLCPAKVAVAARLATPPQTSRPWGALHLPAWLASTLPLSPTRRRQPRHRTPLQMRLYRLPEVLERRPPLPRARRQPRPPPPAAPSARLAARPLGHVTVQHHEPYRLLRQVVGRLQVRRGQEREVVLPVPRQPPGQRLARLGLRHLLLPRRQYCRLGLLQLAGELLSRQLLVPVD